MALTRSFDPFTEMLSLRDAMNRLLEQSFVRPSSVLFGTGSRMIPLDVLETEQGYRITALLPGVKPEDIELLAHEHSLTLKAKYHGGEEGEGQQQGTWLLREIGSGTVERTLAFERPIDANKIEARYENGRLTITVPLSESSRPRRVSVRAATPVSAGAAP
ncbi:MAG: Hsp20/alpha crystallin family protein [Thermogemmatispora sp.]|uniref:Hsp20/alpha crystallin family protein n=1 Tax=Thermogemmatispora sp. TaxID=1968838 RepID=UPI0026361D7D|nr:Hsp20/alpha crystallin family protein [Thermogemmatispora sp.]MBX5457218.1 Hsp20/alpha crystallin family protein [Thermogemmatispora sp.]